MREEQTPPERSAAALVVRRFIRATPERLFDAWTDPEELVQWWGPEGVTCQSAELDARPGGAYRIANRLADGKILWIRGRFEEVQRPTRLVFSWQVDAPGATVERVTVTFSAIAEGTEVMVMHERIGDDKTRVGHARGWEGCLKGLARFAA